MSDDQTNSSKPDSFAPAATNLDDLPLDELQRFAWELGIRTDDLADKQTIIDAIRRRKQLLEHLDRDAMLDIAVWARKPVRASADKQELARHIATIHRRNFRHLSHRGLLALALLWDLPIRQSDPRELIERQLRKAEGFWQRLRRKRRTLAARLIGGAIGVDTEQAPYVFLPEQDEQSSAPVDLTSEIQERGVVSGLARTIRGVTDDYVRQKLDEIEHRIDQKLEQIDRRLQDWRDREITNRLRIIKITLAASVIVIFLSLGYSYIKSRAIDAPGDVGHKVAAQAPAAEDQLEQTARNNP